MDSASTFRNQQYYISINCDPELTHNLQNQGFSTPTTIRHLGIEQGAPIETTISETLSKIDLKTTKRRILATAPPTDILHRATLINSALTPLYNHALMALQVKEKDLIPLYKEIKSFLWTRTEKDKFRPLQPYQFWRKYKIAS